MIKLAKGMRSIRDRRCGVSGALGNRQQCMLGQWGVMGTLGLDVVLPCLFAWMPPDCLLFGGY